MTAPSPTTSPSRLSSPAPAVWSRFAVAARDRAGRPSTGWALPALLGALFVQMWFQLGTHIATIDAAPFLTNGFRPGALGGYDRFLSGAGSADIGPSHAFEVTVAALVNLVGGTDWAAQRVLFTLIVAAAGAAGGYLARGLGARPWVAALAGTTLIINPYAMTSVPLTTIFAAMGSVALTVGVLIRMAAPAAFLTRCQLRRPGALLLAATTLGWSYLSVNAALLAVVMGASVLASFGGLIVSDDRRRYLRSVAIAMGLAAAISIWWALPLFELVTGHGSGAAFGASTNVRLSAFTQVRNTVPNLIAMTSSWGWGFPEYFPWASALNSHWRQVGAFIVPLAVLISPWAATGRMRKTMGWLLGTLVVLLIGAKGVHAPGTAVALWFYDNVPGSFLLRDPASKLDVLLCVGYTAALAVSAEGLVRRYTARRRPQPAPVGSGRLRTLTTALRTHAGAVAATLATGLALSFTAPLWTGAVVPDHRPLLPSAHVTFPSAWYDAARAVGAGPNGAVLILPLSDYYQVPTTWGYYGADLTARSLLPRPVLEHTPGLYFGNTSALDGLLSEIENELLAGDAPGAQTLLARIGVSQVLLRTDIDRHYPERHFADARGLATGLAALPGWQTAKHTGIGTLFSSKFALPGAGGLAGASAITTLRTAGGAVIDATHNQDLLGPALASLPAGVAALTPDQVPAGGSASTFVIGEDGTHLDLPTTGTVSASVRLRGNRSYLFSQESSGGRPVLRLAAATGAEVDGTAVGGGGHIDVDLPAGTNLRAISTAPADQSGDLGQPSSAEVTAVPIADPTAALDPSAVTIALNTGRSQLPLTARTSLVGWSGDPLTTPVFGDVFDCARYSPLSLLGAGIRSTPLPGMSQGFTLESTVHSACRTATIGGRELAGQNTEVRIRYQTLFGALPRVCVYAAGPNLCLPVPATDTAEGWHVLDAVVHVPASTTNLGLAVYADEPVGAVGTSASSGGSQTSYADPAVWLLHPAVTATVTTPTPTAVSSALLPGTHNVAITGVDMRSVLAPSPGPLANCFKSRPTLAAAQITGSWDADAAQLNLAAGADAACAAFEAPRFGRTSRYALDVDVRTLSGAAARVCVAFVGQNTCADLRDEARGLSGAPSTSWQHLHAIVSPPPGVQAADVVEYADGPLTGAITRTSYRGLKLTELPDAVVVITTGLPATSTGAVIWPAGHDGLTEHAAQITSAPLVLTSSVNAATGWTLDGSRPVTVDGWEQGFVFAHPPLPGAIVTMRWTPATGQIAAVTISVAVAVAMLLLALSGAFHRDGTATRPAER